MTAFSNPAPTVGHLIRNASLIALSDATAAAHQAGDFPLRDILCARWHAALDAGAGWRPGIVSLSHSR